jgi:hypothetical protein
MAEKGRYPQIPATVWWGVRSILQKTPNAKIDERLLGIELGVQETAARQYVSELKAAGIINDENRATRLAHKWRVDESYSDAVTELVEANYPEGLRHLAPSGSSDRQKLENWFLREGLGEGSARNRAATYLLIGSREPNEPPRRNDSARARPENTQMSQRRSATADSNQRNTPRPAKSQAPNRNGRRPHTLGTEMMPLNINIQIHISAEAGSEQIESIFSAMKRYLYDAENS